MGPPRPFEVLETFGGKSKSEAPRAFKFCAKLIPTEVDNWWKFGVDISNQLWDIPIWKFYSFKVPPTRYKNSFWKLFLYLVGGTLRKKNFQIWISQSWLEILTLNFHQLLTFIGTRFAQNFIALGASDLDFLPKASKTSNGRGRSIFWATPLKFGENGLLS